MNRVVFFSITSGFSEYIAIKSIEKDSEDINDLYNQVSIAVGEFDQIKKIDVEYQTVRVFIKDNASIAHRRRLFDYLQVMFSGRGLDYYVSEVLGPQPEPFEHLGKMLIQKLTDPPGIWTEISTGVKYSIDPQATI